MHPGIPAPLPPSSPSRRSRLARVVAGLAVLALGLTVAPPVQAAQSAGGQPQGCRPETVALPDGLRPEGITSGHGSTYYVGSLADGRIVTGSLCRGTSRVLLPGAEGRSLRGLFYDRRSDLVWAAGAVDEVGHVWAVSARTGRVVADVVIPGGRFLNDLVVTRSAVWVTDSFVDRLTRIDLRRDGDPTGTEPSFLPLRGAWPAGNGAEINANGIRTLPDRTLVLNNSRVGGLWQVSPRSGRTVRIPVRGGPGLSGGDGLERRGRTVYDVRGSGDDRVDVLRLRRDWPASGARWSAHWVRDLRAATLDVPSTATLAIGSLWAVNARFGVPSPDTASYRITRLSRR